MDDLHDGAPNAETAFRQFYEVSKSNNTLTSLAALRDGIGSTEATATDLLNQYPSDEATKQSLADVVIQVSWMLDDIRVMESAVSEILAQLQKLQSNT